MPPELDDRFWLSYQTIEHPTQTVSFALKGSC